MRLKAWRLPWSGEWVPHGLLDILRGCNLSCRACYNTAGSRLKSLEQLREEFRIMARARRLDSLGIVGGEPLMHPQLDDIIREIKSAGINVEMFTNGLLLDGPRLAALERAGLDALFLHIDAHQARPDLSTEGDALEKLWAAKAADVAAAGVEAGIAITAYPDSPQQLHRAIQFVLNSPHAHFLLVTLCRDVQSMGDLSGNLLTGINGKPPAPNAPEARLTSAFVLEWMQNCFGLWPFAYLGSNVSDDDPRWLTYVAGALVRPDSPAVWSMLRGSATERLFVWAFRKMNGHNPFYLRQSPGKLRVQLLLNALTGGLFWGNLKLLVRSFSSSGTLVTKRILFQCPAELGPDGKLIHCSHCPDATVKHGTLVPVCISDQVVGETR